MWPPDLAPDGPPSILVGVDGSTTSERAVWYAAGLARRQRATLTAVYVVRPAIGLGVGSPTAVTLSPQAKAELAEEIGRETEELVRELGVPTAFVAAFGDPFAELCRVAEEVRADAVVVGASARALHRLLGSLAVRLVKAGRWPVTVVP
jgi:nucleotide-binding universal stress UspA family protein